MNILGIKRIINEIIHITVTKKWLKESIKKLINITVPRNILKLLVEFAVLVQVGKLLRKSAHALEGDDPLSVSYWIIFERLNEYIESSVTLS